MSAQNMSQARHSFPRMPLPRPQAQPVADGKSSLDERSIDRQTETIDKEAERIRAELIVAKVTAHVSPQALIAALLKHVSATDAQENSATGR